VVYRGTDQNIYELACVDGKWHCANLLAVAIWNVSGFPREPALAAQSDPTAFVITIDETGVAQVVYGSLDGNVYRLSLFPFNFYIDGWAWNNLSTNDGNSPPATPAAGRPLGYVTGDGLSRVVYRGPDNFIYELSNPNVPRTNPNDLWECSNLSTNDKSAPPAPAAAGDPFAYVTSGGVPRVIYRGTNGHIYELHPEPFWRCNDLSDISGAPPAAGDPFGYQTNDGIARVIYRDAEGQIIELALLKRWESANLSTNDKAESPAPEAAGNPFGYVTYDGIPRVIYRGTNGHICELHPEPFWRCNDLSMISGAEPAAGDPFGYVTGDGSGVPRVIFRGSNNHIFEVAFV
jgi:hypothetical protein